jgi:hypothetical protein
VSTAAQGFTRAFVDGSSEPYRFDLGFRAFFFLLKWQLPSVYTFIGQSQFFLFSWILGIPGIRQSYEVIAFARTNAPCVSPTCRIFLGRRAQSPP